MNDQGISKKALKILKEKNQTMTAQTEKLMAQRTAHMQECWAANPLLNRLIESVVYQSGRGTRKGSTNTPAPVPDPVDDGDSGGSDEEMFDLFG